MLRGLRMIVVEAGYRRQKKDDFSKKDDKLEII